MPQLTAEVERLSLMIEIGGMPVRVNTTDRVFLDMLQDRYAGFVGHSERAEIEFEVDLNDSGFSDPNAPVKVTQRAGRWSSTAG